ncbi:hypothetical protein FOZ63_027761 [Perkinsus olseni]|uniref:DUF7164 domain-containing protein n=1 Tax=Perkinsus olseni TaxID=32597 RepID=A0A7J6QKW2_PEROL|nr:hypothetical protein FOZ63_027761 [Perkinsus olseni]
MSALITIMAGFVLLALGVQIGVWLSPSAQRQRPGPSSFRTAEDGRKNNRPMRSPSMMPASRRNVSRSPPLWESIGSEAFWKTPQGQARLKGEVTQAAEEVDAVLDALKSSSVTTNQTTVRGVMICLPGKDSENRVRELRALYLSWLLALSREPPDLRTDLLIFTDGNGVDLAKSLGCVEDPRRGFSSPSRCVISLYTPIEDRSRPENQPEDPLLRYSGYINSIVSFAEYDGFDYHLVLRTDTDVFLTPGFNNWTLPENVTLLVGQGGYTVENAAAHLSYVSKTLGLRNEFNHPNVGSTWFGNLRLARAAARLSVASARWLIAEEYSEFEKCCAGTYGWPHWHWGVVSMYSGHLALNHIGNFAKSDDGHGLLDATSTNPDSVSNLKIKHVHCWHTDEQFSKFNHSRKGRSC